MPSHVDESSVETLVQWTFGSLSANDAAQLLRISNHDVQTAVSKYYDQGADGIRKLLSDSNTGWDNTAFASDRYGQVENSGGIPSFNIEHVPDYLHSGGPSGAPSRPPSRASQHSGVSTHAGDAPRQSVEDGQESGVTGCSATSGPVFGPATRDYYDPASWAVVPATKSTEYIPDASIFYQSRDPGMPAFLKPTATQDYLPALLTILHSIPLFRNALLVPQIRSENYWLGDDWWKGGASAPVRTVVNGYDSTATAEVDIIHETQRLMAFLDKTDRAYASLESLFQLEAWKESRLSPDEPIDLDDDLLKFLLRWSWAYQKHVSDVHLDGVLRSTINIGGMRQASFVLDAPVVAHGDSNDRTLYDVLDQALFVSASHNAHIVDMSDVLILRLAASKDNANLDIKVPATLYADRYLEENRAPVDAMFAEMKQYEEEMTKIDIEVEKLKWHSPQKVQYPRKMETLTLLKTSMKAFDAETTLGHEDPAHAAVLAQLQSLYQSIEQKLANLEDEKKKIRDTLDGIASRFRAPVDNASLGETSHNDAPQHTSAHRYTLWGAATSSMDYYVLYPKEKADRAGENQWWHIKYSYSGDDASISRNQVTLDEVLRKVSSDSGKALLVYANEAATSTDLVPLSLDLEDFVRKDNLNFLRDFSQRQQEWEGKEDDGSKIIGNWMNGNTPGYEDVDGLDWQSMSAKEFYRQDRSGISSTTLTPNTEIDDEGVPMEMQEVNGGIATLSGGISSTASSDTVPGDSMDTSGGFASQGTASAQDVEMKDAVDGTDEPRTEHIEVVGRK